MPSSSIVNVTITKATALPSQVGFDTVMLAACHDMVGPRVIPVSSLSGAEDEGFTDSAFPAIHRALTTMFSQSPRPNLIKIGRRDLHPTQTLTVTPLAAQGTGYVWMITIDGTDVTYTEAGSDTVALIIDGLVAAVTAAALGVDPTDNTTSMTLAADTAGEIHSFEMDLTVFTLVDGTADPGIATDLSAIETEDSDWYGLVLDSQSEAEVTAAATWVEARTKLLAADAYESGVPASGTTTDIASDLETAQRDRSFLCWTEGRISAYYAAGRMAGHFAAHDPGRATWAYKRIRGVDTYGPLSTSRQTALEDKQCNHLEPVGGVHVMIPGKLSSGEWIDVTRTIDWLQARIREIVLGILVANDKVPYEDPDIAIITGAIRSFLFGAVTLRVLAADPEPVVTVPAALDISDADRAERSLPDIEFTARIAGAIHLVDVNGSLQV